MFYIEQDIFFNLEYFLKWKDAMHWEIDFYYEGNKKLDLRILAGLI